MLLWRHKKLLNSTFEIFLQMKNDFFLKKISKIFKISPSLCFWVLCSGIFCSVFVTMIFSPPFGVSFDVDIVGISVSVDVTTGFGVFAIKKSVIFKNFWKFASKTGKFGYLQKTIFGLWLSSMVPFVFDGEFFTVVVLFAVDDDRSIWLPDNLTGKFGRPFDWTVDTFVVILAVGFCFWETILFVVAEPTDDTLFIWLTGICLADLICWLLCLYKIYQIFLIGWQFGGSKVYGPWKYTVKCGKYTVTAQKYTVIIEKLL